MGLANIHCIEIILAELDSDVGINQVWSGVLEGLLQLSGPNREGRGGRLELRRNRNRFEDFSNQGKVSVSAQTAASTVRLPLMVDDLGRHDVGHSGRIGGSRLIGGAV